MQTIPLQATPAQTLNVTLSNQACALNIYQKSTGLFCDVYVNNALIIGGVIGQNLNRIVRDAYLGFDGDLIFFDTQGSSDPDYTGLGDRYVLLYLLANEIPSGAG